MKKTGKAVKALLIIILLAAAAGGIWHIAVRAQSKKCNLISPVPENLPVPVNEPVKDDFAALSQVSMHYQIFKGPSASDQPLILIHGNGGSVNSLHEAATYLANDYTVYVTESRCQGQSSDPGVISYSLMASDVVEFAGLLGIKKPLIMGHSDGGMVAVTVAAEYPDFPLAIISCGSNSNPDKFKPYFPAAVRLDNLFHKDKLNDMMLTLPDWTPEYLGKIKCPTYVVAGEYDIMWLSDTVYIHNSIKNSDIAIVKGANHGSYISQDGRQAYVIAKNWLTEIS